MDNHARINAVTAHLAAYQRTGSEIEQRRSDLRGIRKRIESAVLVNVQFGDARRSTMNAAPAFTEINYGPCIKPIVLGPSGVLATLGDNVVDGAARASEIALPGLRACLMAWIQEQEEALAAAASAWEARDPIAEASALVAGA